MEKEDVDEIKKQVVARFNILFQDIVVAKGEALWAMRTLKHDAWVDGLADSLFYRLRATLLASEHEHKVDERVHYPRDWWQAFKERWFPEWVLQRWLVEMAVVRIQRTFQTRMCPHRDASDLKVHTDFLNDGRLDIDLVEYRVG
jgi:hypothetical protein